MLASVCLELKTMVAICFFLQISFYGVKEQPCREGGPRTLWQPLHTWTVTWGLAVSCVFSDFLETITLFFAM